MLHSLLHSEIISVNKMFTNIINTINKDEKKTQPIAYSGKFSTLLYIHLIERTTAGV